jgi:hypothetical protein
MKSARPPITMISAQEPATGHNPPSPEEPPRTRLRQILEERPEARPRLGRAVAALLGTCLVAVVAVGALLIWHLVRRGRLIRERSPAPRAAGLPEFLERENGSPS